jgi:hypothetical protein
MKRIISLAALCALALAAICVQGAAAAETTAWTCVAGGTGGQGHKFTDADCATQNDTTGTFGHAEILPGRDTQLTMLNGANLVLEIPGLGLKLSATGIECVECMAENKEPVAGEMKFAGTGKIKLTGVTTNVAPKCVEESAAGAGVLQTEELSFETVATNEFVFRPVNAETCWPTL